jgi:hypothetical protein
MDFTNPNAHNKSITFDNTMKHAHKSTWTRHENIFNQISIILLQFVTFPHSNVIWNLATWNLIWKNHWTIYPSQFLWLQFVVLKFVINIVNGYYFFNFLLKNLNKPSCKTQKISSFVPSNFSSTMMPMPPWLLLQNANALK